MRDEVERRVPIWRRHYAITLLFKEKFEEAANLWIVLDDQNRACVESAFSDFDTFAWNIPLRPRRGVACRDRDLNGKDRALARFGGDTDLMAEEASQALHDGKTEAKSPFAFARGIVDLMIFVEDGAKLALGNSDSGVPDLDAQHSLPPTATEQYFAISGVFQGVRQQVADHLLEQRRIAAY